MWEIRTWLLLRLLSSMNMFVTLAKRAALPQVSGALSPRQDGRDSGTDGRVFRPAQVIRMASRVFNPGSSKRNEWKIVRLLKLDRLDP